jgi:hypothetical protein
VTLSFNRNEVQEMSRSYLLWIVACVVSLPILILNPAVCYLLIFFEIIVIIAWLILNAV